MKTYYLTALLIASNVLADGYDEQAAEDTFIKENGPRTEENGDLWDKALYYFKTKEKLHHELSEARSEAQDLKTKTQAPEVDAASEDSYYSKRSSEKTPEIEYKKQPETSLQKEARLKREAAIVKVRCQTDTKDCGKSYKEL